MIDRIMTTGFAYLFLVLAIICISAVLLGYTHHWVTFLISGAMFILLKNEKNRDSA